MKASALASGMVMAMVDLGFMMQQSRFVIVMKLSNHFQLISSCQSLGQNKILLTWKMCFVKYDPRHILELYEVFFYLII